ncbi:hypothetical protein [Streptomyces luteogriseus]|uniref:hypothetical protein n=1 Tax=Streptomyces luteogriseus TaxID=68233 RepID=UPI0037F368A6
MSGVARRPLDPGEERALGGRGAVGQDAPQDRQETVRAPPGIAQRLPFQFPAQVLVVRPDAAVQGEQHLQGVRDGLGGVQVAQVGAVVAVALQGAVGLVDVGVEPARGGVPGLVGAECPLLVEDPGDGPVEPVEQDLGVDVGVAREVVGPAGHAACAELRQLDDHEVEVGGAEPVQPGEFGGLPVPEDHVQVVVGVAGRHALVDL